MVAVFLRDLSLLSRDYPIHGLTGSVKPISPRHSLTPCRGKYKEPLSPGLGTLKSTGAIPLSIGPHQPVPFQSETSLGQPNLPALPGAYCARIVEQAVLLFLSRQLGELGVQRMIGR